MNKLFKVSFLIIALSTMITACDQGPAEKKGKSIDQTVENVSDKLQNKGPAQKAGEKLDDVSDN